MSKNEKNKDVYIPVVCEDKEGNVFDAASKVDFLEPICEIPSNVGMVKSSDRIATVKRLLQNTCISKDGQVAIYDAGDGTSFPRRIENHKGIFTYKGGKWNKIKTQPECKGDVCSISFGYGKKLKAFAVRLFALVPKFAEYYISDSKLDINHCIIKAPYIQGESEDISFYEVITKGRNREHCCFVKRYNLYGVPVSAMDISRLIYIYNNTDLHKESNTIKRRIYTYAYYILLHTEHTTEYKLQLRQFIQDEYNRICNLSKNGYDKYYQEKYIEELSEYMYNPVNVIFENVKTIITDCLGYNFQ